jgi:ATP adenylyltransferase/5',5'''-P-1,P-4-tetraphosphate phosphorylase II
MEIKNRLSLILQNFETKVESILNKENLSIKEEFLDINKLREILTKKYSEANPENVVKSQITDEFFEQNGIKYLIKFLKIDKTKNKPILINQKKFNDPFAPPIKEDVLITENFFELNEHRLLLTKFPLFKEQVLLVSRDFKSQYQHLTFENMRDIILLINLINGCGFFNGGEKSGASQPRKHLQAFPYKSFPEKNNNFGIFNYIKNLDNLSEINLKLDDKIGNFYHIKKFKDENIEHVLFKFDEKMTNLMKDNEKANITGEICLKIYYILCEYLNLYEDEKSDNNKISHDFSFLITQEFIFIVKRKDHDIFINEEYKKKNEIINLNSLAFFFIVVSRDPNQIEDLKKMDIIHNVYKKL